MPNGRRAALLLGGMGFVIVALAAAALRFTPLWPGPSTPAGAERLAMTTATPHLVPVLGCPAGLFQVVLDARDGRLYVTPGPYGNRGPNKEQSVVFPSGWAAWVRDGVVELVDREGNLVGRGQSNVDLPGGRGEDGAFHVCLVGS